MEPFQNVSVRILRNDEVVGEIQHSFDIIAHQRQCRRLHRKLKKSVKHAKSQFNEDLSDGENDDNEQPSRYAYNIPHIILLCSLSTIHAYVHV